MDGAYPKGERRTRRSVLKGIGAASLATLASGPVPTATGAESGSGDRTVLGDFESGLDGWTAGSGVTLDRVPRSERPVAVSSGEYGLYATVSGTQAPAIANERRVREADLADRPYVFATVTAGQVADTESDVTVRFRLYHSDGVSESEPTTVRPHVPSVLTWDASSVDATALANATRLELVWYATDRPPAEYGGESDGFDYRGSVVFDDVHLDGDRGRAETVRIADHWDRLEFSLGAYRDTEVVVDADGLETGAFAFESGARVPYTVETLSDGGVQYVLDGVTYLLGGEWP